MRFLQSKYSALSAVQAVDLTFGPLFMKEHIGNGILCTRTARSLLVQCIQVQGEIYWYKCVQGQGGAYWYSVYTVPGQCVQGQGGAYWYSVYKDREEYIGTVCTRAGRSILVQCVQGQGEVYWYSLNNDMEEHIGTV